MDFESDHSEADDNDDDESEGSWESEGGGQYNVVKGKGGEKIVKIEEESKTPDLVEASSDSNYETISDED